MTFKKAEPQQARLKVSLYGPPGSGKTYTTLLMAEGLARFRNKRVAVVDTERGTDFYAMRVPQRESHPEPFDFDSIYTKSIGQITSDVRGLDPSVYGVVVIDSMTHVWDAIQEAYDGKRVGKKGDKIPFGAWAQIKKPYKDLLKFLIDSSFDVFILGRQKTLYEDEGGEVRKVGVAMRAEGETQHEPHVCLRMEAQKDPTNTGRSVYLAHVEKDRSGVLAGTTLINPSFASIECLLPLLGDTQAVGEDDDERIARDGELLDEADEKAAKKAEKSAVLLAELQTTITTATTPEDVGSFVVKMDKAKRYLLTEHLETLRSLYAVKRDMIANKFMGAVRAKIGE